MNESCPIWMSHVPYEWVMSHMNDIECYPISCDIMTHETWLIHMGYWIVHIEGPLHMNEIKYMGLDLEWMSHVPYERVMSHMNESCRIWTSHVTHERYRVLPPGMWHYATWLIHMGQDSFIWDVTRSYGTWLVHIGHDPYPFIGLHNVECCLFACGIIGHDSFICDMTHSYGTWLIHMGRDSFIWDMTNSYGKWLIHVYIKWAWGIDIYIWTHTYTYLYIHIYVWAAQ